MADMGNRMLELLDSHEVQSLVPNTGRVGGVMTTQVPRR
jgi:hypothetical protein